MKKMLKRVLLVCLTLIPVSAISIRAHVVKLGINTAVAEPRSGIVRDGFTPNGDK